MPNRFHYDPRQPRLPPGQHGGGQWTRESYGFLPPPPPPPPGRDNPIVQNALKIALAIYNWLSTRAQRDRQPVIAFKAREYRREGTDAFQPEDVVELTREEVDRFCKRFGFVQMWTDSAASAVRREPNNLSPSQEGTAIHKIVERAINVLKDPDFRAERSYLKGVQEAQDYGTRGSVRIDAFEKRDETTVCVYDIKTGRSGLSNARFHEIAQAVTRAFGPIQYLIITEVRPSR